MDADPKPEPLILPEGIRFPHLDEVPSRQRERIAAARLTTGFLGGRLDHQGSSFSDFFEANVHAPRLWNVFSDLALAILPEVASPIVGIRDEEPLYGPYTDRDAALAVFEPHVRHLVHDGFLEFGITFQHKGVTEEVFVPYAKYLRSTEPGHYVLALPKGTVISAPSHRPAAKPDE
jgi:hypothetical protein